MRVKHINVGSTRNKGTALALNFGKVVVMLGAAAALNLALVDDYMICKKRTRSAEGESLIKSGH